MDVAKICRMCSSQKSRVKSIFKSYKRERLLAIITDVVRLEVDENDGLPPNICKPCASTLIRIQANLEEFRENERELRQRLKNDDEGSERDDSKSEENFELVVKQELEDHLQNVPETIETVNLEESEVCQPKQEDSDDDDASQNLIADDEDQASIASESNDSDSEATHQKPERKLQAIRMSKKQRASHTAAASAEKGTRRRRRRKSADEDDSRPKVNDHKCYICKSESMGTAKALLEHLTVHLDRTPFTCTECKMQHVVLKSVRSLNVHLKMHAQPMKCEYCDRRYSDDRARDYHVKSFHLGESAPCPSTCEQCGKVCKSLSALKSHMRDHKLDLKCEHCDNIFHRRNKLKEHVTRVHEKAEKYECNLCHRVVHSLESYNSHLKMHIGEKTYECDLCPMKFYTAGNLGLHKRIHSSNANYKPHKDWSGHYTVTQGPGGEDKIYTCKLCGKTYSKTVMKINNHLKNHFKEIKCDRCDLKFVNESQLKTHYVVHTGIRQHKCDFCGKDFLHKNNLTQHLKLHRNEQNFTCEFCGKMFTYKEGMKAHIRNHHLRESPYECATCRRKFVDNASLARHVTAEHEPAPPQVDLGPPPLMGTVVKFDNPADLVGGGDFVGVGQ